jgi:hypothetical protein
MQKAPMKNSSAALERLPISLRVRCDGGHVAEKPPERSSTEIEQTPKFLHHQQALPPP